MTKKFENIKSQEIKLNELGEVELSEELANAVSGGFSPEEEEEEGVTINFYCPSKDKMQ